MQESFEPDDVNKLKQFVFVELDGQARFTFPSERQCSGPNMGQITQIAFALRDLTQQEINEQSSEEEDSDKADESETKKGKRKDMSRWLKFCSQKIEKIEKVWNRKLEDPRMSDSESDDGDDLDTHELDPADHPLSQFSMPAAFRPRSQSILIHHQDAEMNDDIKAGLELMGGMSKDDSDLMVKDYGHNVYWKLEDEHNLEDLMAELE